eukprot:TRINITY_DN42613_c0_g1_i1.p1 TRINITY_DN42613_c0_g1~~TRINITY_DN42613_c0_g1_i1.p1  ORF type:complete len:897 (-),score=118.37 TRINITY_DN42613_c0_g1_i1:38-2728(-)
MKASEPAPMLGILPGQAPDEDGESNLILPISQLADRLIHLDDSDLRTTLQQVRTARPDIFASLIRADLAAVATNSFSVRDEFDEFLAGLRTPTGRKPAFEHVVDVGAIGTEVHTSDQSGLVAQKEPTSIRVDPSEPIQTHAPDMQASTSTIVQFSSFMYFCEEEEDTMVADVIRIGDLSRPTEVHYRTKDGTAKSGVRYHASEGCLIFAPGEFSKPVKIELIQDDSWNTTLEFGIELLEDGLVGATRGRYLFQTRVKVIDNTVFPTDKFKALVLESKIADIPKWGLLIEYFKMNWQSGGVRWGTKKMLLADLLHNAYYLLKLLMNVYLIDYVLNIAKPESQLIGGSRDVAILLFTCLTMVPFAFLHFLDFRRLTWKVGGRSRAMLQKSLLRKFMNYDQHARESLQPTDIIMAMTRDSVELVHNGYMNVIGVVKSLGQLCMILVFQVAAPRIFDKPDRPLVYAAIFGFPLILLVFLLARSKRTNRYEYLRNRKQDALIQRVSRTAANYRLIADYNQRPRFVDWFERVIGEYNVAAVQAALVNKNNEYFAPWVSLTIVCVYTFVGGKQVVAAEVSRRLGLGMFLTNVSIFTGIGGAYGSLYKTMLSMQSTFDSLDQVVTLMNLPTDLKARKALHRNRRRLSKQMSMTLSEDEKANDVDKLSICVEEIEFAYKRASTGFRSPLQNGKFEIQQGTLVALVGPRGEGKSTLLKILGGVILPKGGNMLIPTHLRMLHVSNEPLFMQGTLLSNLTFGVSDGDPDGDVQRVKNICASLGLDDIGKLIASEEVLPWADVLSQTQRQHICLARALISNPEVLCVHKPTSAFDERAAKQIMAVLRDFVQSKGLQQDVNTAHLRRPRTCIFTTADFPGVAASDVVFSVNAKHGIQRIPKEDVTLEMLS